LQFYHFTVTGTVYKNVSVNAKYIYSYIFVKRVKIYKIKYIHLKIIIIIIIIGDCCTNFYRIASIIRIDGNKKQCKYTVKLRRDLVRIVAAENQ